MRNPIFLLWPAGRLSGKMHPSSSRFLFINSYSQPTALAWTFRIEHSFPTPINDDNTTLLDYLMSQQVFSTSSQARRAIRHGKILVLAFNQPFDPHVVYANLISPFLLISSCHSVHQVTRLTSYPVEVTKYVYPPKTLLVDSTAVPREWVVYENEEIAVVHKPENMTTIDAGSSGRDDLQSLLPFILAPPPSKKKWMLPRPVHRLDRATSGLVIVAKTQSALRRFSGMFANQAIHKTYTAVVFGKPQPFTTAYMTDSGIVDYPIDGKHAVTEWKVVETNDMFSRIELHPRTGRNHQLRRHLAYCLKSPIVGDAKYDLVGTLGNSQVVEERQAFREGGLFLCCNQLEFDYPVASESGPANSYSITEDNRPGTLTERMRILSAVPLKMFDLFEPQT
jgi:23S rRNA pseudouridine1911/1915/1917 synthase